MTALLEDIRLALRQICRAIGMDETAATVIPLVVLGLALNIAALSAVEFLRIGGTSHSNSALRNAARTEIKAIRIVMHSTIRKINDHKRQACPPSQWVKNQQKRFKQHRFEVGVNSSSSVPAEVCDLKLVGNSDQPRMIAFVQC